MILHQGHQEEVQNSCTVELDTDDVVEISQSFICNKCGTELTINRQSVVANEPPKHCKDPMEPLD